MLIKKKINFALEFRRKGTKKNGNNEVNQENLPLRMRVSYNNMRIEFVTGYRIDANKWDAENQRATGMTKLMQTASEVNDYLAFLKAEIIKVFHKYELMEVMPTREQIKDFNISSIKSTPKSGCKITPRFTKSGCKSGCKFVTC